MYEFIGDIHGHADELEQLLVKLGYQKNEDIYSHPSRKVFFLGDFIDRGPQIKETLQIAKAMVDSGNAVAIMGNHEYNAICFHLQDTEGGHFRKHSIKNILQHVETLKQFQNNQHDYEMYIEWFMTLPLFFEDEHFRTVHACWDDQNIIVLKNYLTDGKLSEENICISTMKNTELHRAVEETLKGKEIKMPKGLSFNDKDGNVRNDIRIKWWDDPSKETFKTYSIISLENLPDLPINNEIIKNSNFYKDKEKPVFFGHYWLSGNPSIIKHNVCCLDFSVAKGGDLVAYRFDNETELINGKIEFV